MPDLIQFDCPSCAATLRVPLEMAGLRGPCPICHRDIIAPNPYTGIGAHFPPHHPAPQIEPEPEPPAPLPPPPAPEPPQEPAPVAIEPPPQVAAPAPPKTNHPFADKLIESPPVTDETPIPSYHSEEPASRVPLPPARGKSRAGLIVGIISGILLALAAGFFIGNHFRPDPTKDPLIVPRPVKKASEPEPPAVPPPAVDPATKPPEKPTGQVSDPEPPLQNKTSLENAQTTLRAFLEAPDWAARSTYVLSPETIRPKMEAYAANNNDGPTPYKSFTVEHSQVDSDSGTTLLIFKVDSPATPGGIPVAILETPKGWLVDWESFVEFRDDLFKEFAEGPSDHVGEFHVIVTAPDPTSAAQHENDTFSSFVVAPPLPSRQKTAFVKKSNPAYEQLREATANGRIFAPVLKITKATTKDGRSYLEILSIQATDWRPRGAMPEP